MPRQKPLQLGMLELDDLRSLVMEAGRSAGFHVVREVRVSGHSGVRVINGAMDCGWYDPHGGTLLVAWEFDGRDVRPVHLAGDSQRLGNAKKFAACGARVKVQALYSVRHGVALGHGGERNCRACLSNDVRIVTDQELVANGDAFAVIVRAARSTAQEDS